MEDDKKIERVVYRPKYPLGEYIKRWCKYRGLTQMDFARGCGYNEKQSVYQLKTCTIGKFFAMVDFMVKKSALPEEFYLVRLKSVIQRRYLWQREQL